MIGVEDIVGLVGRVAYGGIQDDLLDRDYLDVEELDLWAEDDKPYWRDRDLFDDEGSYSAFVEEKQAQQQRGIAQGVDPWAQAQVQPKGSEVFNLKRWSASHENGRIPENALVPIGAGHFLRADAAWSWKQMRRQAKKDGVNLAPLPGSGNAYRDIAIQERLAAEKGLYSQGGLAAEPGTSPHGWGYAVDADLASRAWLAKHGHEYGWNTIPREPWHWEFHGSDKVPVNAFNQPKRKTRAQRPQPRIKPKSRTARAAGAIEDVGFAPEYSALTVLPGAVLNVLTEPLSMTQPQGRVRVRGGKSAGEVVERMGFLPKFVPKNFEPFIRRAAAATGLTPALIAVVIAHESGFNPKAVSSAGAQGLMQIMPLHGLENPFDPAANIMAGARILASYIKRAKGDIRLGLAYYNAGPNNTQSVLQSRMQIYSDPILKQLADLRRAA